MSHLKHVWRQFDFRKVAEAHGAVRKFRLLVDAVHPQLCAYGSEFTISQGIKTNP